MNASHRAARAVLNGLRSLRLAVGVLSAIVIASALGTMVPQGNPYDFYVERYGLQAGRLVWVTRLSDLYHAWWFLALLAWLLTGMAACSLSRLRTLLRKSPRKPDALDAERNEILRDSFDCGAGSLSTDDAKDAVRRLSRWLRHRFYRVSVTEGARSEYRLTAEKGASGRFGAFIIHWGCIAVLAGGFLSMLFARAEKVPLGEHETIAVPGTPYRVRLHDFSVENHPGTDRPMAYHSRISVLEEGRAPLDGTIRVNEPFCFRGLRFYQMDYQAAVRDVRVRLERASDGHPAGDHDLRLGERVDLPKLGLALEATDFQPDFVFHDGKAGSRSEEFKNPAVRLRFSSHDGSSSQSWVFPDPSGSFHRGGAFPYRARIVSYEPRYSIGLKIVKDAARPVVYAGYIIVIMGTFLSSAVFHRRLSVRVAHRNGSVSVELAGAAGRNRIDFENELKSLRRSVEKTLRPGGRRPA